jgi:HrpA-like RNA helicase
MCIWLFSQAVLAPAYITQVLEPRRVAAKVAARRMAALLGQPVGGTVGYRVRLETRVSRRLSAGCPAFPLQL